jgi:threonine dehydrogenase-like Zn-dependent dehydrogenase
VERPEPQLAGPRDVKLRVLEVGVCGTDRDQAAGGHARAPEGRRDLVIGHEMLGIVTEVGENVRGLKPGDLAVPTVRRGCGKCAPCAMGRPDACRSGDYRSRGITGLDGFQSEWVVDEARHLVRVPHELADVGVLAEPCAVVEKAVHEASRAAASRAPDAVYAEDWPSGGRCLVAGLGPVGLLAAMVLMLRGVEVYGMDVLPADSSRPYWLTRAGGTYLDGRRIPPEEVAESIGPMDLIVEAAGEAQLAFALLGALSRGGVCVLTGLPGDENVPMVEIPGPRVMRRMVSQNQTILGSINAAREHFDLAIRDLRSANTRWGDHVRRLVTSRLPVTNFASVLAKGDPNEIKTVLLWREQREAPPRWRPMGRPLRRGVSKTPGRWLE